MAIQPERTIEQHQQSFVAGDRVSVMDDSGDSVIGTVKWSGRGAGLKGDIVGIETVSYQTYSVLSI